MSQEKDWIQQVEDEKEKIKKWPLTDRLSLVSKLTFMNGSIASSVTGWHSWLTNATVMTKFTEEELQQLTKEFEDLVLAFLDLDIKYTKLLKSKEQTIVDTKKDLKYVS